ncbi:low-density lipoprotein receptor-related protein 10 [Salmo salar]|uniref:Low-density lipoprotein receptor-related protein 10-like n=1 Tax=Salmo salar TaxID=8030 RepID=A0A1S3N944_SALSA|nr:low-density lipoprotein receptor-related protein 10 [Salmo salar]XP_014011606.1 low-density lipoprotein receptor-related protein 10 [Salmo salar]|eukprot:XP_014011605.1 PREDICTED: low-density lipoprotein receptor-related protein 10-like [Salmo salar]
MTAPFNLCVLNVLFVTAYSSLELASSTAHCGQSPQVLEAPRGEIRSSVHHSWSYRPRPLNCSWIIKAHVGEPVILSFSQFSTRCKKEWVSVTSSTGKPITFCGSDLPKPMELMGGNITVTHHFLPHLFPVSAFCLGYIRDSGECPVVDFECLGGRCLPLSWRCNGRTECLGEGMGLGTDEQDCDGEIEILDPEQDKVVVTTTTPESYIEREGETGREKNGGRDWETAPVEVEKEEKEVEKDGDYTKVKEPDNPIEDYWEFLPRKLPSPQPHRAHPGVTRAPIEWPCGGLLQTFYGTFAPPSINGPSLFCVWTLDPQDSRPLKLDLQLLELGPGDTVTITNRQQGTGELIKTITSESSYKAIQVESRTGLLSLTYRTLPGSVGLGFNATYRVGGYCPPWEGKCGGAAGGCYTQEQKCDGRWDCPETGHDEAGCRGCPIDQFACGGVGQRAVLAGHNFIGRSVCFPAKERCNYQLYCADGSDEKDCTICQPGTFHCDSNRCVFESWSCDGQVDCKDGTDEMNCTMTLPRKVITAATVGSLVCGLLLVIAMGCTCKLYSLRTREYSMFAPISRQEAELIQQQAPPSYGQLIAQGIIPPVEDFPTENPNESSSLSLRGFLQLLRQDTSNSPRRRRRPRFIRRAVRRMRRWGLIPRSTSRPSQPSSSAPQQTEAPSTGVDPSQSTPATTSLAVEAVNLPLPQKLGLLPQTVQYQPPPPPHFLPPPTLLPPPIVSTPANPQSPPVAVPPTPSSPSLASLFHSLGRTISRFRSSPSSSPTNSLPLSTSPSFSSSSSEDEVLLIPLSEDTTPEDDVPLLTLDP